MGEKMKTSAKMRHFPNLPPNFPPEVSLKNDRVTATHTHTLSLSLPQTM